VIVRFLGLASALVVLALYSPSKPISFGLIPAALGALWWSTSAAGHQIARLGLLALGGLAVALASSAPLQAVPAAAALVLAGCVLLPMKEAPAIRPLGGLAVWLLAGALMAVLVLLPARAKSLGSPALLDPITGAGLVAPILAITGLVAIVAFVVGWSGWQFRSRTKKASEAADSPSP
jgi:hypothetical protein